MTVQFSETVTGFAIRDITVVNGTKGNFVAVDGDTYTFDITQLVTVSISVDIAGAVAKDVALNDNTAAPQFIIVSDKTAPTVTKLGDDTVDVSIEPAAGTLDLVFSEPLSAAGKLAVTGAITTGANNGP